MFIDEVQLTVISGKGGAGCISFHREARVPKGGPDGGNGGKGGDVVIVANSQKNTLVDYRHVHTLKAHNGAGGSGGNRTGRSAVNLVLRVPAGTIVRNAVTGEVIADLDQPGASTTVAPGGKGGRGNAEFATATNQAPRIAEPGQPGIQVDITLELKLLADVGIIGYPNVGKSTLISRVSASKAEIGDYPFTTLIPNLGVVERFADHPFVMADVPGLIEGAHEGKGLGTRFLKHVQRTSILLHLLDATRDDPTQDYQKIRQELKSFDPQLAEKPEIVALNKIDVLSRDDAQALLSELAPFFSALNKELHTLSAVSGEGIDPLLNLILNMLKPRN